MTIVFTFDEFCGTKGFSIFHQRREFFSVLPIELVKYLMNLVMGGHHIGVLFKHIGDQGVAVIGEYKLVFSLFQKIVA